MTEQLRGRLFSLPEYDYVQYMFVDNGVKRLMEAKDEVWGSLRTVQPTEAIPITQNTAPSGEIVTSAPIEIQSEFKLSYEEIRSCDVDALASQIDKLAGESLSLVMPRFFDLLRRSSEAAGTATDLGGRPISYELWLEIVAKVDIDFDDQGKPDLPTLIVGPEMAEQLKALPPPTKEQLAAMDALIEQKRKDHNARRRNRKLR
jgi:hypothetical protein